MPRLPAAVVDRLVEHFGTLQKLLSAGIEDLQVVEGVGELRARSVREGLSRLAESTHPRALRLTSAVPRKELSRMPLRLRTALVAVVSLLLAVDLVAGGAAVGDPTRPVDEPPPEQFTGLDGLIHVTSQVAIQGKDGYLYLGSDFDTACAFGGRLKEAMDGLAALARIIEKSGRRALFTVSPNKSVVAKGKLPDALPQGECARRGMSIQSKLLDGYRDRHYVPIRRTLVRTPGAYWRTDSHWSTVGTSVLAEHLARELDPNLARAQQYRPTSRRHRGDLSYYVSGTRAETAAARVPHNGVRTVPAKGSPTYDPSLRHVHTDLSWISRPAPRTYPGRTLVLGDSFTYVGLEALSNLFRKGRFIWTGTVPRPAVVAAIKNADTVVFSVVQRFAPITPLISSEFQTELKAALGQ